MSYVIILETVVVNWNNTLGFKQGSGNYIYDANGNMIVDPNKGLSDIKYNNLNLPYSITKGANKINYIYDVTGRKLANKLKGKTKYYLGNFVYTDDKLEYMICSEGLLNINGSTTNYEFHLKDHLGNTRVAVNETNDITQENNYYPFGLTFAQSGSSTNKYLYNGKELQEETGFIDFGALQLDKELGRWFNPDPLAEDYVEISLYNYVANNPIIYIDPDGQRIDLSHILGKNKNGKYNNEELANAFLAFAQTDLGKKVLSWFAEKGQKIEEIGLEFDNNGKMHNVGMDLTFECKSFGKWGKMVLGEFETKMMVEQKVSLNLILI
ncbi:RHS repeat domain-containing protein [Vallitalea sp.]|uniref:RHS repeat domain-containing protein n=1 Tax=Vallitalea sp. TaxID=1882829 RepID=UPI0025F536E8|nr:RHS repeat-associated core domain-containing protein [Vallitalea sp.]MCT4688522.1 RHS repeat-associated core domain-containing protein [Vallitalea sp.]